MIRSKIEINGKSIAICKVDRKETIQILMEEQINKGQKSYGTYHAHKSKDKRNKNPRLEYFLHSLVVLKQRFETTLLKAKIKLEDLKKYLKKTK